VNDRYDPEDLDKDDAFDLATTERRRHLLRIISEEGRTPLGDLVDAITTEVYADPSDDGPGLPHESVRISLLHTDLPKLVAEDVVVYDESDGVVAPGENIGDLDPLV
jgi:hypothetical protein